MTTQKVTMIQSLIWNIVKDKIDKAATTADNMEDW